MVAWLSVQSVLNDFSSGDFIGMGDNAVGDLCTVSSALGGMLGGFRGLFGGLFSIRFVSCVDISVSVWVENITLGVLVSFNGSFDGGSGGRLASSGLLKSFKKHKQRDYAPVQLLLFKLVPS